MKYNLECACGVIHEVDASQSETEIDCTCGAKLAIPTAALLQELDDFDTKHSIQSNQMSQHFGGEPADSTNPELEFPLSNWEVLTPGHLVNFRIHSDSLDAYIWACNRLIRNIFKGKSGNPAIARFSFLMMPRSLEVEVLVTDQLPKDLVEQLVHELKGLVRPRVIFPIAFCGNFLLNGGLSVELELPDHFAQLANDPKIEKEVIVAIGGLIPREERSRIPLRFRTDRVSKIKHRLQKWFRYSPPDYSGEALFPELPGNCTIKDANELIAANPKSPELFGSRGVIYAQNDDFENSFKDFDRLVQHFPKDARAHFARGVTYWHADKIEQALSNLDQAIELNPNYCNAYFCRGRINLMRQEFHLAADDFRAASEADELFPHARVALASVLLSENETDEGVELLDQALELNPYDESALWLRYTTLANRSLPEDFGQVLADIDHMLWIEPFNPSLQLELAKTHLFQGRASQAIHVCDDILSINEKDSHAMVFRSHAYLAADQPEMAMKDINAAIEHGTEILDDYAALAFQNRARLNAIEGEFEDAIEDARKAIELEPKFLSCLALLGQLYLQQEEGALALETFERAEEIEADNPFLHEFKGHSLRVLRRSSDAISEYEKAIALDDTVVSFYVNRAYCLCDINDYQGALDSLNKAVALSPKDAEIQMARSWLLNEMDNPEAALDVLNKLLELEPDFSQAIQLRASVNQELNNFGASEDDFNRLVEMWPDSGFLYASRAEMWLKKGDYDKANEDYKAAVENDPESAEFYILHNLMSQATIQFKNEEFDLTISTANEMLEKDPEFIAAYSIRGESHWYSEQFVEAIDDFTSVVKLSEDDNYDALSSRGQVYAEIGEYDLAITDLKKVIDAKPEKTNPSLVAHAHCGLGLAYVGQNDFELADQHFRNSIETNPENAWLQYNQGLMYVQQKDPEKAVVCFDLALQFAKPKLPPRKKQKAEAYLKSFRDNPADESVTDPNTPDG